MSTVSAACAARPKPPGNEAVPSSRGGPESWRCAGFPPLNRGHRDKSRAGRHALPHLAVPGLHAVVLPVFFPCARRGCGSPGCWSPRISSTAGGIPITCCWFLLDRAGLLPGHADGPLPARRDEGRRRGPVDSPAIRRSGAEVLLPRCGLAASAAFWPGAVGPATLRPTLVGLGVLVLLMASGALLSSRRIWLFISLVNNLALLLFFKYAGFVVENLNALLALASACRRASRAGDADALRLYLRAAGRHFLLHLPVAELHDRFLPGQRAAGAELPALRHLRLLLSAADGRAQSSGPGTCFRSSSSSRQSACRISPTGRRSSWSACSRSWRWPTTSRYYVERVYDNPGAFGAPALMLATFAFAWQIFFDFSGYTDMARGVAKMMGFNLILNFSNPYLATGHRRLLDALAHQPLDVVPRLRLHPAGRQSPRHAR